MNKYQVTWVEEEKAGAIIWTKSAKEALKIAKLYDENDPRVEEFWDRIASKANRYKVMKQN